MKTDIYNINLSVDKVKCVSRYKSLEVGEWYEVHQVELEEGAVELVVVDVDEYNESYIVESLHELLLEGDVVLR